MKKQKSNNIYNVCRAVYTYIKNDGFYHHFFIARMSDLTEK